jgi:hypothetical protein
MVLSFIPLASLNGIIYVNDKSVHVPGGYIIPLTIKDGLTRLDIRPHTDHEFDTLSHVFLTLDMEWDPTVLDHQYHGTSE